MKNMVNTNNISVFVFNFNILRNPVQLNTAVTNKKHGIQKI
jgi:hypothetical protein